MKALFLHSWGSSKRDWALLAPLLPFEIEPTFVDLRGFGDAPAPPGPYDVASYADDVLRLVEGWTEYLLVGHSMGGKFALAAAMRRPEGLSRLLLVAPSPPTPEPMSEEDRAKSLADYGDRAAARETVAKVSRAPLPEAIRQAAEDDYVRTSERGWKSWLEAGSREDISGLMDRIEVPVRVVVGAEDPVMHPEMLRREVADRLKDATLTEISGAGHLLPVEKPHELAAFVASNLRS